MHDAVKVRTGTPDDLHPLMELFLSAGRENGLTGANPLKLLNDLWAALNRNHGIVGVIGEPGGRPEAAILLRVESMWYSDEHVLMERVIFVDPEFRSAKGGRARLLCEFAKKASDTLEMPLIIGILSSQRTEGKVRLYERQFGPSSGAYWIYGGVTGQSSIAAE